MDVVDGGEVPGVRPKVSWYGAQDQYSSRFVIPLAFSIYSKEFTVEFDTKLLRNLNVAFAVDFHTDTVYIAPDTPTFTRSHEDVCQSFLSAVTQVYLSFMKFDELDDREQFNRLVGSALHQVFTTMKFSEDIDRPMMGIPESFYVFGKKFEVVFDSDTVQTYEAVGLAKFHQNKIVLTPSSDSFPRSQMDILTTLYHEIVHIVLSAVGEDELSNNETFVNMMGAALSQMVTSAIYEDDAADECDGSCDCKTPCDSCTSSHQLDDFVYDSTKSNEL